MRTVSYTDLKNRFTSALGVDSLLTSEETAFKRSLNDRVRGAWTRAKWPDLIRIVSKTVAAVDLATLKADKAVQIDGASDLFDVFVGTSVPASDYGDGTTTLPAFLERHLLAASLADWYRADGQNEKAALEEQRAEEYLLQELDRAERLSSQNSIVKGQYQAPWPTISFTQKTV